MIRINSIGFFLVAACLLLVGCGGTSDHKDLKEFVDKAKNQSRGVIEPLPPFTPYKSFSYGAMTLRSPFDPPAREEVKLVTGKKSNVKPDLNREKEYLEGFNLGALTMVGTLERDGVLWALVNDGEGGIHRVTQGNYVGKNHGRIIIASQQQIEIIEIVSDGTDGWVERPKVLQLVEKE